MAPLILVLLVPAALAATPALDLSLLEPHTQVQDAPSPSTSVPSADTATPTEKSGRTYLMQFNARVRYMGVPDSLMNIGFFNANDPGANPFPRPKLHGWAMGAEYVFNNDSANYVIYAEYLKPTLKEGYWDDVEVPADHSDGDWVRPDGLGAVVIGGTYLHEIEAIPVDPEHKVGLSFLFGAGLGLTVITGGLEVWHPGNSTDNTHPDCLGSSPAFDRYTQCASDGYERIPKVLPMVDLQASARVNFANHFHIRIDGGIHDVLFLGTALGAVF